VKVAWFAPMRRSSAIGWSYGLTICRALSRTSHVDIWSPAPVDAPDEAPEIVTFREGDYDAARLSGYDLRVYNLGDNYEFHGEIFALARRHPGIVILHDFVMHNFFRGYFLLREGGVAAYGSALEKYYGTAGRAVFAEHLGGNPVQSLEQMARFPLFEVALERARGAIVHSDFLLERVRALFPAPAAKFFMAAEPPPLPNVAKRDLGIRDDEILLVSIGYINRNRHIEKVLRLLGENLDISRRVRYRLVGPCTDTKYLAFLHGLVRQYDLGSVVEFMGYTDSATLRAHFAAADIFMNLRFPATESASSSVVEQMLAGKAIIVTDTGFYSELPDAAVRKISPEMRAADIGAALRELIHEPRVRNELGRNAAAFVRTSSTGSAWAASFEAFAERVLRVEPVAELIDAVSRHAMLMGIDAFDPVIDRITDECAALFLEK
jgi:glycosyltransferase involved in cell wall biosynthesis